MPLLNLPTHSVHINLRTSNNKTILTTASLIFYLLYYIIFQFCLWSIVAIQRRSRSNLESRVCRSWTNRSRRRLLRFVRWLICLSKDRRSRLGRLLSRRHLRRSSWKGNNFRCRVILLKHDVPAREVLPQEERAAVSCPDSHVNSFERFRCLPGKLSKIRGEVTVQVL